MGLDDGTLVDQLSSSLSGVSGGGQGNSQSEKPWVIFFQPYLKSRKAAFCPADTTQRSTHLAADLMAYNGGITSANQNPTPGSEQNIAEANHLTIESYLLNSIFSHKSARYALEGELNVQAAYFTARTTKTGEVISATGGSDFSGSPSRDGIVLENEPDACASGFFILEVWR